MKKFLAVVLVLTMALGVLASCGAGNNNDGGNGGNTPKVIVVGYTIYAPMNYMEGGELVGFDTDLAKAVFEGMGYKVRFQEIDWNEKYTDLESGNIDCVWNGFTCNTADDDGVMRADKVDFSYNYMENRQVVVVKADSGITSAADLAGKKGGAEKGSAGETYAATFEGATIKTVTKQTDCLMEVKSGNLDFAVFDAQLAKSYAGKGDYSDLIILDDLSSDVEFYAIGFKKGSDLTAKVNEQLEKLAADGTIAEIAAKYGVTNTTITDFSDQKK
jgi:polar amino acid transport system substrate-binding protein